MSVFNSDEEEEEAKAMPSIYWAVKCIQHIKERQYIPEGKKLDSPHFSIQIYTKRGWKSCSILNAPPPQCWHTWQAGQLPRHLNIVETLQILICFPDKDIIIWKCTNSIYSIENDDKRYELLLSYYKIGNKAIRKRWNDKMMIIMQVLIWRLNEDHVCTMKYSWWWSWWWRPRVKRFENS